MTALGEIWYITNMLVDRMSRQDAQDLLRHCVRSGTVIPGKHFQDELANESLEMVDALAVLEKGQIYNQPEFHTGKQEWNYRVEGYEPGGKWLAIVFCFRTLNKAFLITVFSLEAKNR